MKLAGWTREPLAHFLAAGAALFALFAWMGEDVDPASRTITVTQEDRARLALQWERTFARPPTDGELDALTEQFVREEVLYREALRLGLDRDDAVVRKRMATKMDFLATSAAETAQPDDAVLQKWLEDHPTRFASDARFTFDQLYFAERPAAEAALKRLAAGASGKAAGIDLAPGDCQRYAAHKCLLAFWRAVRCLARYTRAGTVVAGAGAVGVRLAPCEGDRQTCVQGAEAVRSTATGRK